MDSLQKILVNAYLLPQPAATECLSNLDAETANQLLDLARSEKMFPFLYETLAQHHSLHDRHHEFAASFRSARSAIDDLIAGLRSEMGHVDYLVVKGKGIEAYYPPHLTRHYLDIDMSVRDLDSFWTIANYFLQHEMDHLTTMRLFTEPDTQQVHGFARFDPVEETDTHKVEIQIGAYLIEYGNISRSLVRWEDLSFQNSDEQATAELKVPDQQGNLLIYLAELLSRERLLLRDLVDVYYLTQEDAAFDLNLLLQRVQEYHLQAAVCMLYQGYQEHPGFGTPPLVEQLYLSLGAPKLQRYRFLTQHLMPYLRQHSSTFLQAAGLVWLRSLTDRWNMAERNLSLLKWTELRWDPYAFYRRGVPIYFAKINDLEIAQLTHKKHDRYYYALTPIGSYAVSLHALLSDEEMDLLHEHIVQEAEQLEEVI